MIAAQQLRNFIAHTIMTRDANAVKMHKSQAINEGAGNKIQIHHILSHYSNKKPYEYFCYRIYTKQ